MLDTKYQVFQTSWLEILGILVKTLKFSLKK